MNLSLSEHGGHEWRKSHIMSIKIEFYYSLDTKSPLRPHLDSNVLV